MKDAPGTSKSPATPSANGIIRFGNFEVDPSAGELRRGGLRIKLGGQPFDVLVTLLQKPGQVVTREELHDKLWAQDTFVDFEHGLNKAINKVREALGDDADNPRFVETLPRRGYRFLAAVTRADAANSRGIPDTAVGAGQEPALSAPPAGHHWTRFSIWSAPLLAVLLMGIFIGLRTERLPRVKHYTQLTNDGLKKNATVASALATDGSRVYFWEQDGQQGLIAQVSVAGGSVSTLASFQNVRFSTLDYSAATSELLFSFDFQTPLWALRVPEGSARRRIGDFVVDDGSWAPDGQFIAFSSLNKLMVAKADGSQPRVLATSQDSRIEDSGIEYPRWSPDGKRLRFNINSDSGQRSIWEVAADGTNLHPLFTDWISRNDSGGSWTPDSKYFVYNSVLPSGHSSIFAIRQQSWIFDSRKPVELTPGPLSFSAPLMSTDGKKIFAIGFLDQGELVRHDSKTNTWVPYLSGISAAGVDFSRDSQWVTYVLVPEGTLWRSRVGGGERMQLTVPPMRAGLPRWSPDGNRIVFLGLRPGGQWTPYLVSANGGQPEQLVPEKKMYSDPTWSADGKRIVFGEGAVSPKGIHVVDVESRQVSDLPGSAGLFSPRWSPEGRLIIALTGVDESLQGPQKLMIFDLSTEKWREWSEESESGFNYPAFSRDGRYVYFSDVGAATFFRLRWGDKKPEPVAKIDAPGGMKQTDLWYWSGLTPDDSPLFLRDNSAREIYALDVDFP